jgi:hypothetical protein
MSSRSFSTLRRGGAGFVLIGVVLGSGALLAYLRAMKPGGVYGRCLGEGEELEAKVIGAGWCEGLERIGYEHPSPEGCVSDEPPSLFVCAACGDGACGVSEVGFRRQTVVAGCIVDFLASP